jgi:glutaredoxin
MASWRPYAAAAGTLVLLAAAPLAWGQYKVVGPDGRVTYTDRPPAAAAPVAGNGAGTAAAADPVAGLPYALRTVAQRYPVTLYTVPDCQACDEGRHLLRQRGIPFQERTASTDADRQAWDRTVKSGSAPALSIGSQWLTGVQADAWHSYLDAAGYPRQSQLPASYQAPPPRPLAEGSAGAATAAQSPSQTAAPTSSRERPAAPPANPGADPRTGIRF